MRTPDVLDGQEVTARTQDAGSLQEGAPVIGHRAQHKAADDRVEGCVCRLEVGSVSQSELHRSAERYPLEPVQQRASPG